MVPDPIEGRAAVPSLSDQDVAHIVYRALPWPLIITTTDGRIVALNDRALTRWNLSPEHVLGLPVVEVFGLMPLESADHRPWDILIEAFHRGQPVVCRVRGPAGANEVARVRGWMVPFRREWYWVLTPVVGLEPGEVESWPAWAFQDSLTGLGNRRLWELRRAVLERGSGSVVLFDLDNLKSLNDVFGHGRGDQALALVGSTLAEAVPEGGLAVRWGGDEFLVVLPDTAVPTAEAWAEGIRVAVRNRTADWGNPLSLSFGVAPFAQGALERAVTEADERLYEQKGVVLRSRRGGRLVITTLGGPSLLRRPESSPPATHEHFGGSFGALFQKQYVQSLQEAREFVAFVDPEPGIAAVELGAGSGRITFDGGLAQRIGPDGVLLVTDPSPAQLRQALRRAQQEGAHWVSGIEAPAEHLPVMAECADLIVGALFWHLCEPQATAKEIFRVLRPGGRAVISTALAFPWPPAWQDALAPIREALARHNLPFRHFAPQPGELAAYLEWAGLEVERRGGGMMTMAFADLWSLRALLTQGGYLEIMVRALPEAERNPTIEQVLRRVDALWPTTKPQDWSGDDPLEYVAARRPLR
jgi:diguanylate cyclase (GGDEF)-like protein